MAKRFIVLSIYLLLLLQVNSKAIAYSAVPVAVYSLGSWNASDLHGNSFYFCKRYADLDGRDSASWTCVGNGQELKNDFVGDVNYDDDLDYAILANTSESAFWDSAQFCKRYADVNGRSSASWTCANVDETLPNDFVGDVNYDDDLDYMIKFDKENYNSHILFCRRYADLNGRSSASWHCVRGNEVLTNDFVGDVNDDDDLDYKITFFNGSPFIHINSQENVVKGETFRIQVLYHDPDNDPYGDVHFNSNCGAEFKITSISSSGGYVDVTIPENTSSSTCRISVDVSDNLGESRGFNKTYSSNEFVNIFGGYTIYNYKDLSLEEPNKPPTANAPNNITINEQTPFSLTCSGSDPDGDSLTYEWRDDSGDAGTIWFTTNGAKLSATSPSINVSGGVKRYNFSCRVFDGKAYSSWSQVSVDVDPNPETYFNNPIVVNPDSNQTVSCNVRDNGSITSYEWKNNNNGDDGDITFTKNNSNITFYLDRSNQGKTFSLSCRAKDNLDGWGDYSEAKIYVNHYPYILEFPKQSDSNETTDYYLNPDDSATVVATAGDEDTNIGDSVVSYVWSQQVTSGGDQEPLIVTTNNGTITFTAPEVTRHTIYKVTLTVKDSYGLETSRYFNVIVNKRPTFDIEGPDFAHEQTSVTFKMTNLNEDGTVMSWRWTNDADISLENVSGDHGTELRFTLPDIDNRRYWHFTLTAVDDQGVSNSKTVTLVVNAVPELSPQANTRKLNDLNIIDDDDDLIFEIDNKTSFDPEFKKRFDDFMASCEGSQCQVDDSTTMGITKIEYSIDDGDYTEVNPDEVFEKGLNVGKLACGQNHRIDINAYDIDGGKVNKYLIVHSNCLPHIEVSGWGMNVKNSAKVFLNVTAEDSDGAIQEYHIRSATDIGYSIDSENNGKFNITVNGNVIYGYEFKFEVVATDDMGGKIVKQTSFIVNDVFNQCGDTSTDPNYPPEGSCHKDEILGWGVINNDTCQQIADSVPFSWVNKQEVYQMCEDRHIAACKICIPENADQMENCTVLKGMLPPERKINETDFDPNWKPWEDWGITKEEYISQYNDPEFIISRCTNSDYQKLEIGGTGMALWMPPIDNGGGLDESHRSLVGECNNWEPVYICTSPAYNNCGDINGWNLAGESDIKISTILQSIYHDVEKSFLYRKKFYEKNPYWDIKCFDDVTNELTDYGDFFCDTGPDGKIIKSTCTPWKTQQLITMGAQASNQYGDILAENGDVDGKEPLLCVDKVSKDDSCHFNVINSLLSEAEGVNPFIIKEYLVSEESENLLSDTCGKNVNGTPFFDIGDWIDTTKAKPMIDSDGDGNWEAASWNDSEFKYPWESPHNNEDCHKIISYWLMYSGYDIDQWCTLQCSDGTTGKKIGPVACNKRDPSTYIESMPEGYKDCIEPIYENVCEIDATIDIQGSQGTGDCTDPVGSLETAQDGTVISQHTEQMCRKTNAVINCIPDPNCHLVSIEDTEDGTQQHQSYQCIEKVKECKKYKEVTNCDIDYGFKDGSSSFLKAAQASKMASASGNSATINGDKIKLFSGKKTSCTYMTAEGKALIDAGTAAATVAAFYFGGPVNGTIAADQAVATANATEIERGCCSRDVGRVRKTVQSSMFVQAVNSIAPVGEEQRPQPVCSSESIRVALARSKDREQTENGWQYVSGTAIDGKPYDGTAQLVKDDYKTPGWSMDIGPCPVCIKITIKRNQDWCVFKDHISRIIQTNAKYQLKNMISSATGDDVSGKKETYSFKNYANSQAEAGWKDLGVNNGNTLKYFAFDPTCKQYIENINNNQNPEGLPEPTTYCPLYGEAIIGVCSKNDCGQLPEDPTEVSSIGHGWDIWVFDNTQYHQKTSINNYVMGEMDCDDSDNCSFASYAWEAGNGLKSVAKYQVSFPLFGNENGFSETPITIGSMTRIWVPILDYKNGIPSQIEIKVKEGLSRTNLSPSEINSLPSIQIPTSIPLEGVNVTVAGLPEETKLFGGCDENGNCNYEFVAPLTIELIPDDSCDGVSLDQIQIIDFDKIDFGSFQSLLKRKAEKTGISDDDLLAMATSSVIDLKSKMDNKDEIDIRNGTQVLKLSPKVIDTAGMVELRLDNKFKRNGELVNVDHIKIDWGDGQVQEDLKFDANKVAAQAVYDIVKEQYDNEKDILDTMRRNAQERNSLMMQAYQEYANALQGSLANDPNLYYHTTSDAFLNVQNLYNRYLSKRDNFQKIGCFYEDGIINLQGDPNRIKSEIIHDNNDVSIVNAEGRTIEVSPRGYFKWTTKPYCGQERAKEESLFEQIKNRLNQAQADLDKETDLLQTRLNAGDRSIHVYHYYNGVDQRTIRNIVVTPYSSDGTELDPITFKVIQTSEVPTNQDEIEAGGGYVNETSGQIKYNGTVTRDGQTVDDIPRLDLGRELKVQ